MRVFQELILEPFIPGQKISIKDRPLFSNARKLDVNLGDVIFPKEEIIKNVTIAIQGNEFEKARKLMTDNGIEGEAVNWTTPTLLIGVDYKFVFGDSHHQTGSIYTIARHDPSQPGQPNLITMVPGVIARENL